LPAAKKAAQEWDFSTPTIFAGAASLPVHPDFCLFAVFYWQH
jgi:hypothetical protein